MKRLQLFAVLLLILGASTAHGDIYQWEYIDPLLPDLGRQQSITLAPDGAGLVPAPNLNACEKDLTMAYLSGFDLSGSYFTDATLTNADLSDADLYFAKLVDAQLTTANLRGANLTDANLENANLRGANLTDASFLGANLIDTNFTDAVVREAVFGFLFWSSNLNEAQLQSTASYRARDLKGIVIESKDVSGWSFAGQDLTASSFFWSNLASTDFSGANLRGVGLFLKDNTNMTNADARGGSILRDGFQPIMRNFIYPDGHVEALNITAGETLRLWDFDPSLILRYSNSPIGDIPILVEEVMSIDPDGTLRLVFEDDQWGSTITFDPGIPVTLAGTLELLLDGGADPLSLAGTTFPVFDWSGVAPAGTFNTIALQPNTRWDTSQLYTTGDVTLIGAVPEPATAMLLAAFVSMGLVRRSMARRAAN